MKLLSLVAFIVMGASVSATTCPDLRGTYSCSSQDGETYLLTVDQKDQNGVTNYVIDGETFPADGQVRSFPDNEYWKNSKETYSCAGESTEFVINSVADFYDADTDPDTLIGISAEDTFFSKDASDSLVIRYNGAFTYADGTRKPWASQEVCTSAN